MTSHAEVIAEAIAFRANIKAQEKYVGLEPHPDGIATGIYALWYWAQNAQIKRSLLVYREKRLAKSLNRNKRSVTTGKPTTKRVVKYWCSEDPNLPSHIRLRAVADIKRPEVSPFLSTGRQCVSHQFWIDLSPTAREIKQLLAKIEILHLINDYHLLNSGIEEQPHPEEKVLSDYESYEMLMNVQDRVYTEDSSNEGVITPLPSDRQKNLF